MLPSPKRPIIRIPFQPLPIQKPIRIERRGIGAPDLWIIMKQAIGHQDVVVFAEEFAADAGGVRYLAHERVGHLQAQDFVVD